MKQYPVAIITGASRGIGKSCAIGLAQAGYQTVLISRTESTLQTVVNEINKNRIKDVTIEPLVCPMDVTDKEKIRQLIDEIQNQFGRVDLLINCAGMLKPGTLNISDYDFENMIKTNLVSPIYLMKKIVPLMKKAGKGHIFNIISRAGKIGFEGEGAYVATKFGLLGFSESLYRELSKEGISVTAICPGWVNTDLSKQAKAPLLDEEMIQPEDIIKTIAWVLELAPNTCVREITLECFKSIA